MTSFVVQFRQATAAREYLLSKGLQPNEFGREAFEKALRILQETENVQRINRMAERIRKRTGGRSIFGGNVVDLLRRDRESH